VRIEEAFAAAGLNIRGEPIPARRVRLTCAGCGIVSPADAMQTEESGDQTNYICPDCGAVAATVSPAPGLGGYRLGDWVVNSSGGMAIDVPGPNEAV